MTGKIISLVNPDFKELLLSFNAHNVEYLIVGAHALAAYGHVRATKDLDMWVKPSRENAEQILAALSDFGAPLRDLTLDDLSKTGTIVQIGIPPCGSISSPKSTALRLRMHGPLVFRQALAA